MSPEEARIIRDVFDRVRQFGPVRDTEARNAVDAEMRANPDAAVGLVQAVVMLERERATLEARVNELESGNRAGQSGGLFGGGSAFGGNTANAGPWGGRAQPQPGPAYQPQQQAPTGWQQQPQQQQAPQQNSGGGIFSTILGAATGLAAGYVGYQALQGLFGGNHGGGLFGGGNGGLFGSSASEPTFIEEQPRTAADDQAFFDNSDSSGTDLAGGFDSGDFGGGDDFA